MYTIVVAIKFKVQVKQMTSKMIKYVGVTDRVIDLFEGQYSVPDGITYNSYVIKDKKIAVMDSVDKAFLDGWLKNIEAVLEGACPDFLVVQHMEPDHSANVAAFLEKYPSAKVVASLKAFSMMKNFFGTDFGDRRIVVSDGDKLSLGEGELTFITAPMVHWPEVIMSYYDLEKTLFSADGFGRFGSFDASADWADEARRYYIGIVGKYGAQVEAVLKKAANLDIERICSLHGPVLSENLGYYLNLYDKWSKYEPEEDAVTVAYTSVYGNTKEAVELLCDELRRGGAKVAVYDLARCDMAAAVADAFKYSKLVLATTTYNADIFPHMREFINHLTERGFKKRTLAFIENGSWAPMAAKVMRSMLEECRDITYLGTGVKILSAVSVENIAEIKALANELLK